VTLDPPGTGKPEVILVQPVQSDDILTYLSKGLVPHSNGGERRNGGPVGGALHVERGLGNKRASGHEKAPPILTQIATIPHTMRENTANAVAAAMT